MTALYALLLLLLLHRGTHHRCTALHCTEDAAAGEYHC